MITEDREEVFIEATESSGLKIAAAVAAIAITALVFAGYAYLRKRHVQTTSPPAQATVPAEPKGPPQALILVDEAMIQGGMTTIGGTVRNISPEKLSQLRVELELKRRKDGTAEQQQISLTPSDLEPSQEGRYAVKLRAQEYSSARVIGLAGATGTPLRYTLAQGEKRPPERLDSKTIIVDKPAGKRSEFLNSPDNPARVP